MMPVAYLRRAMVALALVCLPTAAAALSIAGQRSHDRVQACAAVERVLADIASKRLDLQPFFSTEKLGFVDYDEREAFIAAMTSSEGKPDQRPLRLTRFYRLSDHKFSPLYIAAVDRLVWHEYRDEDDGNGFTDRIHDPRHYPESSYWLISFESNQVAHMREAFEVYQLADEDRRVKGCGD